MNKYFGFDLDDHFEDLWHELERVQDGDAGHHIAVLGKTKDQAVDELLTRLKPFFVQRMYDSDESGYELESQTYEIAAD